jgi:hypothetical protein
MKLHRKYNNVLFISLLIVILAGCAKIVAPTGGPKDEQHPLIEEINPANYSTNFKSKKVKITFDEFIQLKDLKQNLIISPLMDTQPKISEKGKSLHINFEEALEDSTTYNIYFGNSVQDYNEGNAIENFQYVFSTGDKIDSMSVQGQVLNSFNLLPEKDVYIMLYITKYDSIPYKEIPTYISKTNEEGIFRINNIRMDSYKLFCLRDLNKNYLFDMPDEDIAFIDTLIQFDLMSQEIVDTIYFPDSLNFNNNHKDSTVRSIDTIINTIQNYYSVPDLTLMLFNENKRVQYLANSKRDSRQKIEIMFNKSIKDSIIFELSDTIINTDWYIKESSINNDTVFYWLTDSIIYKKEYIDVTLSYQKEDSNLVYQWVTDSLSLRFFEKEQSRKKKEEVIKPSITTKLNVKNKGSLDLNKNIILSFEQPLSSVDNSKINLLNVVDSVDYLLDFNVNKVNNKFRVYELESVFPEDSSFRLEIYPGAFTDISNNTNDTTIVQFKVRKLDSYGKLLANIEGIDSSFQAIAQIILPGKEKEKILREKIIDKDQIIEFELLDPKEYIFKVILDKNKNGKWDSGEYLKNILPEEVLYYEKEIKVRANWDFEILLNLKKQ